MDTPTPRTSAYLLVVGLALSIAGTLLAGDEASVGTWTGGALLLLGFVMVVTALVRWALRPRPVAVKSRARVSV